MTTTFSARYTRLSRFLAGLTAAVMTVVALALLPYADLPAERVALLVPVFSSVQATLNAVIAYLVVLQFYADRKYPTALISIGFAFSALLSAIQIVSLPGVFTEGGNFERFAPIAIWLWVARLSGHALLILLAMLVLKGRPALLASERSVGYQTAVFAIMPVVLAVMVYAFLGYNRDLLPGLMDASGSYSGLAHGRAGYFMLACWTLALLGILLVTRLQRGFDCWLAFSAYSYILYLIVNFTSASRFTIGWYTSRFFELAAAATLLGALLFEVLRMQQRLKKLYSNAYQASIRDGLTGLYSRRYFDTALARELAAAERSRRPLSLLMVDIDYFKQYNDTHGHLAGDDCIRRVAASLLDGFRGSDIVARYGGEEFVVILPDTGRELACQTAERLRSQIMALGIPSVRPADANEPVVTVSIGLSHQPPGAEPRKTMQTLIGEADDALYEAKRQGRNRVVCAAERTDG
ncbi:MULTISPECIES: sensor domain-containing diguanylate cyclase [Microvirgula]|uniref:sensor domain-containing diguanylate cyclase n=1 Tax=Microvirgula TaxID=57479 RepID=UPI00048E03BD|nr:MULTISPECIES: sensor domain-containing diguanylate cyclase [Microvirgula]RAS11933.1 diguanylate cyclase (GGDEF)-like protein [Microvirgula sp. AG722]